MIADVLRLRGALSTEKASVHGNDFRRRRLAGFLNVVDEVLKTRGECRVLDLGGEVGYWAGLQDLWTDRPMRVTLINRMPQQSPDERLVSLVGDACAMPDIADKSYDVVHSNSVLEHVGDWSAKRRMAAEARRLAPRYFVQTPNYWFPMEPHFRTMFIHWLPRPMARAMVMRSGRGCFHQARSVDEAYWMLDDSSLLDMRDMSELFPDAKIMREKIAGLTKSLTAVR
jgi:hypothetical protein